MTLMGKKVQSKCLTLQQKADHPEKECLNLKQYQIYAQWKE